MNLILENFMKQIHSIAILQKNFVQKPISAK